MRPALLIFLSCCLLLACKTPKLAERLPGRWAIEHYEEFDVARDRGSEHTLDECGYVEFRRGGFTRQVSSSKPHGSLSPLQGARVSMEDSFFVIRDAAGASLERWLLTKDLTDYMEWVRVSEDRDSVFTLYLRK